MSIEYLKLENVIEAFRGLKHPVTKQYATDLQPQAILVFLMIARGHEEAEQALDHSAKWDCYVNVSEIKRQLRLSSASASRNVAAFTERGQRSMMNPATGKHGFGTPENPQGFCLVESAKNEMKPTQNILKLTNEGVKFAQSLKRMLKTSDPEGLQDLRTEPSVVTDKRTELDHKGKPIREDEVIEKTKRNYNQIITSQTRGMSLTEKQQWIQDFLKTIKTNNNPTLEKFLDKVAEDHGVSNEKTPTTAKELKEKEKFLAEEVRKVAKKEGFYEEEEEAVSDITRLYWEDKRKKQGGLTEEQLIEMNKDLKTIRS